MEFRRVLFRSGGIAAGQAVANGSSRGAACAGLPGFAWPEWRIDVSPGLFAGCGATSDGHAHRRMAAFRSSRVSLGIPATATAPAVPYVSGPPTVTTAWRLHGLPAPATILVFVPAQNGPPSCGARVGYIVLYLVVAV